jgi:hypothetical protein
VTGEDADQLLLQLVATGVVLSTAPAVTGLVRGSEAE